MHNLSSLALSGQDVGLSLYSQLITSLEDPMQTASKLLARKDQKDGKDKESKERRKTITRALQDLHDNASTLDRGGISLVASFKTCQQFTEATAQADQLTFRLDVDRTWIVLDPQALEEVETVLQNYLGALSSLAAEATDWLTGPAYTGFHSSEVGGVLASLRHAQNSSELSEWRKLSLVASLVSKRFDSLATYLGFMAPASIRQSANIQMVLPLDPAQALEVGSAAFASGAAATAAAATVTIPGMSGPGDSPGDHGLTGLTASARTGRDQGRGAGDASGTSETSRRSGDNAGDGPPEESELESWVMVLPDAAVAASAAAAAAFATRGSDASPTVPEASTSTTSASASASASASGSGVPRPPPISTTFPTPPAAVPRSFESQPGAGAAEEAEEGTSGEDPPEPGQGGQGASNAESLHPGTPQQSEGEQDGGSRGLAALPPLDAWFVDLQVDVTTKPQEDDEERGNGRHNGTSDVDQGQPSYGGAAGTMVGSLSLPNSLTMTNHGQSQYGGDGASAQQFIFRDRLLSKPRAVSIPLKSDSSTTHESAPGQTRNTPYEALLPPLTEVSAAPLSFLCTPSPLSLPLPVTIPSGSPFKANAHCPRFTLRCVVSLSRRPLVLPCLLSPLGTWWNTMDYDGTCELLGPVEPALWSHHPKSLRCFQ